MRHPVKDGAHEGREKGMLVELCVECCQHGSVGGKRWGILYQRCGTGTRGKGPEV